MKKQFILISATVAVIIAATFAYTQYWSAPSRTTSTTLSDTVSTTEVATFRVGTKTYSVNVTPSETVMNAMRELASTGDFSYTSKEYPGLGAFVDSINGQKNSTSKYWILFVNGTTTPSGASATNINAGDVVEWKYEKGY